MNQIGIQIQREIGGSVNSNNIVIFNKIVSNIHDNIDYNIATGEITILKPGSYYIDWWVSTESTLNKYVSFTIFTQDLKSIKGESPNLHEEVSGNALIKVTNTPYVIVLLNNTSKTIYYSEKTPIRANLTIVEIDDLNLVNGNNTGSVMSIDNIDTYTMGQYAIAIGEDTYATGRDSFAQGTGTTASGNYSHAEGRTTKAIGDASHAEGRSTTASGLASHSEGLSTKASGVSSHAEGEGSWAISDAAHAEGGSTRATEYASHAEGQDTTASGKYSHAEGDKTIASGSGAHAEGQNTIASGINAHAEGDQTTASGEASHAEGYRTRASSTAAHAEGYETIASGVNAHAEGRNTTASGPVSHAEGYSSMASGVGSHAQGGNTIADARDSFAGGSYTTTDSTIGTFVIGKYGGPASATAAGTVNKQYGFFLANGIPGIPALAAMILGNGEGYADKWNIGGADYAELFETIDGKSIEPGYFVTFEGGDKVRKANENDKYILGIVSNTASIVANTNSLAWKDKYLKDEWGKKLYDENGNLILNPLYNKDLEYIPRENREEWVTVGVIGQIKVRDNGDCIVGGYCKVGKDGKATPAQIGYPVIKRTSKTQIIIMFNSNISYEYIMNT